MKVCLDASNLRAGGGRTHLIEFLSHIDHSLYPNLHIEIWASSATLNLLPNNLNISKKTHPFLERGLFFRSIWQKYILSKCAELGNSDIIFSPGGNYAGKFKPAVTMSRNMLPFEWHEIFRYFPSFFFLKIVLLRMFQIKSFNNVNGLIFLSSYAERSIMPHINSSVKIARIPHGLNQRFLISPQNRPIIKPNLSQRTLKLLYVSQVDKYKHQEKLIEAVSNLRLNSQLKLKLVLIGASYKPSLRDMNQAIKKYDPLEEWVDYKGSVPFSELHNQYQSCDIGVFASTCENLPNTLLEMMGAGLPIICSNHGPMPEILKDSGLYFDPLNIKSIEDAILKICTDDELREQISSKAYNYAKEYSWKTTTDETIEFLQTFKEIN